MLLRSITKHVKDQNWFAVFIDFVIVVLGILLAFQITNWNEARKTALKQKIVEARLIEDFRTIDQSLNDALAVTATIIRDIDTLQDSIDHGQARTEDDIAIKRALLAMRAYPNLIRKSVTYDELTSSGTLNLIRNDKLRQALALYNQRSENRLFNLVQVRSSMIEVFINITKYAKYAPLDRNSLKIRRVASYDLRKMSEDKDFQNRLDTMLALQTVIYYNLVAQRKEADQVMQEMTASLDTSL